MVFAELPGGVTKWLEQFGNRRVFLLQTLRGTRQTNFSEPCPDGRLACNKRGTSGGAALLPIPVREERAFVGNAIDVGRLVAHHALIVGTDVPVADVISPEDQDVRLLLGECRQRYKHNN